MNNLILEKLIKDSILKRVIELEDLIHQDYLKYGKYPNEEYDLVIQIKYLLGEKPKYRYKMWIRMNFHKLKKLIKEAESKDNSTQKTFYQRLKYVAEYELNHIQVNLNKFI